MKEQIETKRQPGRFTIPDREGNPEAYQYYSDHFVPPKEGEVRIIDGLAYEKRATEWTMATYFRHPGPGWDNKAHVEDFGFSRFHLEDLPEVPYYDWFIVRREGKYKE